jgi:ADP-ribose pyrophosphatase
MSRRREYPNRPIVGVGIMIRDGENYLLIKRAANPDKGQWSVPGGLVEVGERIQDAAVREAKEETCIDVKLVERLGVVDKIEYDESGEVYYHFIIIQYLADMLGGDLCPMDDALEAKWITLDQLPDYDLTNSLRDFLIEIGMYPVAGAF